MRRSVVFSPLAQDDLDRIYDFIAKDSPINAIGFIRRLAEHCLRLADMPYRGRALQMTDGVRSSPFERRAVIAYHVASDRVTIIRIAYAGQDLGAMLAPKEI